MFRVSCFEIVVTVIVQNKPASVHIWKRDRHCWYLCLYLSLSSNSRADIAKRSHFHVRDLWLTMGRKGKTLIFVEYLLCLRIMLGKWCSYASVENRLAKSHTMAKLHVILYIHSTDSGQRCTVFLEKYRDCSRCWGNSRDQKEPCSPSDHFPEGKEQTITRKQITL